MPNNMAEGAQSFIKLMYHGRGASAYAVTHDRLGDYVAQQLNLIRSGEEGPLNMRFANGEIVQLRCKTLPNGGRLLTYGNVSELVRQADDMERLASIDGMTGLNNRRHFLELAGAEWSRFQRYGRPLAALILDIDLFKSINDTYGHDAGDEVIKTVAAVLQKHKRNSDIAGRLGGEEFALILPEATIDNATAAAERLRKLVADQVIDVKGQRISVTISVGASHCTADSNRIEEILKEADIALYQAKRAGRNRVCRFEPSEPPEAQAGDKPERRAG
jgi:diguanylate cyclase (GGDEF)-like protein